MTPERTLPWDWHPGTIPANVSLAATAYVETSFSFVLLRSERDDAVTIGHGASTYLGTMFDLGRRGRVSLGDYALVHGARIICDAEVTIGDHALISWNVVLMDTYRVPLTAEARRPLVRHVPELQPRRLEAIEPGLPIHIGRGAWIGFDSCVLPGVHVGEGAIVGARSVVAGHVEPFTVVAGNPARMIRRLTSEEIAHGR